MAWDFETEPEFQEQLDWMDAFVREAVEPLDRLNSFVIGIADGPAEGRQVAPARQMLRNYQPDNELFPAYGLPRLREEALEKCAEMLTEMEEPELAAHG